MKELKDQLVLTGKHETESRESGALAFAAQLLSTDLDALLAPRNKQNVLRLGGRAANPPVVAKNVRKLSKQAFTAAIDAGHFVFLARHWQCATVKTFTRMRDAETYGFTDESRAKLSASMSALKAPSVEPPVTPTPVKRAHKPAPAAVPVAA